MSAAELNQYLAANTEPTMVLPRFLTETGAHLPTLEAIRLVVQEWTESGKEQAKFRQENGMPSPFADGYLFALGEVTGLLSVLARGEAR